MDLEEKNAEETKYAPDTTLATLGGPTVCRGGGEIILYDATGQRRAYYPLV